MSPPFAIRDLGEVALRCRDLDVMLAFYRDMIGLPVLRPPVDGIAFFKICQGHAGHTTVLALFEGAPHGTSSLHHLALNIAYGEQEAALAWFDEHGLAPRVQCFPWIGWRGVFVSDPEGNTVELVAYDPNRSPG
ncbi:MAG: VOC family protein [Pseudomonadota bacterium]